jgi:hypothetical protein
MIRIAKLCVDCKKARRMTCGRCLPCFRVMDKKLLRRLQKMSRAEREAIFARQSVPELKLEPWTWEGQEEELAEQYGEKAS